MAEVDRQAHISELFREYYKKDLTILVMGKFGVGKSSLVNAIVGKPVAVSEALSVYQNCVSEAKQYLCKVVEGIDVLVWDSPGLQDGEEKDDLYLADVQQRTKEIDVIIYCLRMDDARFYPADKRAIKNLTGVFGKQLWKHTVIALTFANEVQDPFDKDQQSYFMSRYALWRDTINSFFTTELNIGTHELPRMVPTGHHRQQRSLPYLEDWLTKLWMACCNVANANGSFNLVRDEAHNSSCKIIMKKCLLFCAFGFGVTLVYALLNYLRPKKPM
ncbi:translocase of chloroplast 34, chloroplastic-like [Stylophora pistillata]|nr:translocase of chloroplast 34, chloroplastic-like [Stylophora pistillata]